MWRVIIAVVFYASTAMGQAGPAIGGQNLGNMPVTSAAGINFATQTRFYTVNSTQTIYVRNAGSDTTGDGLASGTAYATVPRALKDIPEGWFSNIIISMGGETYAGAQNWTLPVMPGWAASVPGTHGTVTIMGDCTTPDIVATSTGAGALVTGKLAEYTFTLNAAYAATITDGSDWAQLALTATVPGTSGLPVLASTTPNLILVGWGTAALSAVNICPYSTVFSGRINAQAVMPFTPPYFFVTGVKFSQTFNAFSGMGLIAVNMSSASIQGDVVGSFFSGAIVFYSGALVRTAGTNFFNANVVKGATLTLEGPIQSVRNSVFRGTATTAIQAGYSGSTTNSFAMPAFVNSMTVNDFETTGNAITLSNHSSIGRADTGGNSFAVTGSALILDYGASCTLVASSWTGTQGAASKVLNGAYFDPNGLFLVTNSSVAGQDMLVGLNATPYATASHGVTDLTDLSRWN